MSLIQPSRRGFLSGIIALAVAPAIVRAESLMAVKPIKLDGLFDVPGLDGDEILTYSNTFGRIESVSAYIWSLKVHREFAANTIPAHFAKAA